MSYRSGVVTGIVISLLLAVAGYSIWWLQGIHVTESKKSPPFPIPASVPKPLKEEQINTLTLTADAEKRLALRTGLVERQSMRRTRLYGGEVMVPIGQSIIASSPIGGTLRAPTSGIPLPGQTVKLGQPIFELSPILTPEGRANLATSKVEADGQVKNAETMKDAATIALTRAKQLLKDEAGSQRQVEEAQAQLDIATKSAEAAVARREMIARVMGEIDKGIAAPFVIPTPLSGILRNISATAGQFVPPGAALFEVLNTDRVWIRVPIYVGDLSNINTNANALVNGLKSNPKIASLQAQPIIAPPSANATAGTVDLYYELDNRPSQFSPAHRVSITLLLKEPAESLTVPWSAVVHDIYGGTWIYEQTTEHTYARRRVTIRNVQNQTAVLNQGPFAGMRVVVAGAAELFGTETGFSK